jgi:hypothetical protein
MFRAGFKGSKREILVQGDLSPFRMAVRGKTTPPAGRQRSNGTSGEGKIKLRPPRRWE